MRPRPNKPIDSRIASHVLRYLPLVRREARRVVGRITAPSRAGRLWEFEDVVQEAAMEVMQALQASVDDGKLDAAALPRLSQAIRWAISKAMYRGKPAGCRDYMTKVPPQSRSLSSLRHGERASRHYWDGSRRPPAATIVQRAAASEFWESIRSQPLAHRLAIMMTLAGFGVVEIAATCGVTKQRLYQIMRGMQRREFAKRLERDIRCS